MNGQIGLEPDFKDYLQTLKKIMDECWRVLKDSGSCWINLGDTYAGKGAGGDPKKCKESVTFEKKPQIIEGVKNKSCVGIPARFYVQCIDDGWIARNNIPWVKNNGMPSSSKDNFTNKWEPVFFFVKNNKPIVFYNEKTGVALTSLPKTKIGGMDWEYRECTTCSGTGFIKDQKHIRCNGNGIYRYSLWHSRDYYFNLDAVREKTITETKPINKKIRDVEKDHIQSVLFDGSVDDDTIKEKYKDNPQSNVARLHKDRHDNNNNKQDNVLGADGKPKANYKGFNERWKNKAQDQYTKRILEARENGASHDDPLGNPSGKNPGDVFYINTQPFSEAHFATFPPKLPEKILKCACPQEVCTKCDMPRFPIIQSKSFPRNPSRMDDRRGIGQKYQEFLNENPPNSYWLHQMQLQ